MCKFKTGTNTDYNKRAGFNIRICQNKVQIQFVPWFVLHKNVVQCINYILADNYTYITVE